MNKMQKILKFIRDEQPDRLTQIQNYVKAINGTTNKETQGYYTSNLKRMVDQGLLERKARGVYVITDLGERYIVDKMDVVRFLRSRESRRIEKAIETLKRYIQALEEGEFTTNDELTIKIKI